MQEVNEKYRAPALEKGLDIIELLADTSDAMSQADIAKALNRSQSEIYRMLSTLVGRGYVVRSVASDSYALSLKLFSISQRQPPVARLIERALPKMRALTREAWQSCHIGMESNGDIVVVASAESPGNWGIALKTGTVIGLCNTGTGRALAAFRSESNLENLIALHRPALGEPAMNRHEFDSHLERIRRQGYEQMPSATAVGVTNLSFPILDPFGEAVAVLSCPYLKRLDDLKVPSQQDVTTMFRTLATELSGLYGGK